MEQKIKDCQKWLCDFLSKNDGGLVEHVREKAKLEGFNKNVLKKARKRLGVKTFHQFDEDGATENWFWHLP